MQKDDLNESNYSLRALFPQLSEEQLMEATENIERYLAVSVRMYNRITRDPRARARFASLTASRQTVYDDQEASRRIGRDAN